MTKYLGIDYGIKRIGLAISDDNGNMAFPYRIIENKKGIASEILKICNLKKIVEIILGESINYEGVKNPIMVKIEKLKKELETNIIVHYEQEFLTSHQASKSMNLLTKDTKKLIDASAAAIILQSYIDKKNETNN